MDLDFDSLLVEQTCPKCGKNKVIGPVLCEDCYGAKLETWDRNRLRQSWENSLPRRFRWATVASEQLAARTVCSAEVLRKTLEAARAGMSITLTGPSASGKTSLGCACCDAVVEAGCQETASQRDRLRAEGVRFANVAALARARLEHPLRSGACVAWELARTASVLLLDELEARGAVEPVTELLHERHDECRQTLITTGLDGDAIENRYGSGIARRIFHPTEVFVVKLGART